MTVNFSVRMCKVPSWFQMPCIACEITGQDGRAICVVNATSGLGLAACPDHTEVTQHVMRVLRSYELAGLRASFVTAGITPEPQHDRGPGEGVVYGSLPGARGHDRSHSVTDVMFGRFPH